MIGLTTLSSRISRRELLGATLALPLLRAWPLAQEHSLDDLRNAPGRIVTAGDAEVSGLALTREWNGEICRARVTNRGAKAAGIGIL